MILGSALSSAFSVQSLGKTTVYYYNADNGDVSKNFDDFLKIKDIKDIINVKNVKSYNEGVKLVNSGEGTALIYIDKGYSDNINKDSKGTIQLYESKSDSVRNSIVNSVIDSYNTAANTMMTSSNIAKKRMEYVTSENVKENYLTITGKTPRAIDYYAVTMIVMIIMYGASYGCSELDEIYFKNIGKRIKTTKVRAFEHITGVVLGAIFTVLLQGVVLVAFTKYVYGANWGNNPLPIILIMIALSILSTSIGVMVSAVIGDSERANSLIRVIVPIFTFVSGGYFKIPLGNSPILNYVPNKLAQTALFNTVYNGSWSVITNNIIMMFILSAVLLIIAAISGRRKLA
jgi:ABC-2 type transport system permease protein